MKLDGFLLKLFLFILLILFLISYPQSYPQAQYLTPEDELAISGFEQVATEIEHYFGDKGFYPLRLSDLITEKYLAEFPINPYKPGEKMKQIPFCEFYPGGLVYLPYSLGGESIDNFVLGLLGGKSTGDELRIATSFTEDQIDQIIKSGERWKIVKLPQSIVKSLDSMMKQIALDIQSKLEEYFEEEGEYPVDLKTLKEGGYLEEYPDNPYYLLSSTAQEKVEFTADIDNAMSGGILTYYPYSIDGKQLRDYFLGATGIRESERLDLFYALTRWDGLYELLPENVKSDERKEGYIIWLKNEGKGGNPAGYTFLKEHPEYILHDATWLKGQPDYRARDQLFQIQISLARYYFDNGVYPPNLDVLVEQGYCYWLLNPYADTIPNAPKWMKPVKPGEFTPGGIVYLPYTPTWGDWQGKGLVAYELLLLGSALDSGMDVGSETPDGWKYHWQWDNYPAPLGFAPGFDGKPDGVILILSSRPENHED